MDGVTQKICSRCCLFKWPEHFHRDRRSSDGLFSRCISCRQKERKAGKNKCRQVEIWIDGTLVYRGKELK